jgi:hypothetical protein
VVTLENPSVDGPFAPLDVPRNRKRDPFKAQKLRQWCIFVKPIGAKNNV